MNHIFRYDNPVMLFFQKIAELLVLNLLWLICCIPIVTIGASTTALYKVCLNSVQKIGNGPADFWKYFRGNFRQATLIWIAMALWGAALVFDWYFLFHITASALRTIGMALAFLVSVVYAFVLTFVFPLQASFENTVPGTVKNALLLSFANPVSSAVLAAFCAIPVLLIVFTDMGVLLLLIDGAPIAWGSAFFFQKIFALFVSPQPETTGE